MLPYYLACLCVPMLNPKGAAQHHVVTDKAVSKEDGLRALSSGSDEACV